MTLSILIPSLESRAKQLTDLVSSLIKQLKAESFEVLAMPNPLSPKGYFVNAFKDGLGVEILTYVDNKEITTGEKRNRLLNASIGEYICYVDDDDFLYKPYIREILKACQSGCDCVSIEGLMTTDKRFPIRWKISKDFIDETVKIGSRKFYKRFTNHLAPVKRLIAIQCGFPDKSNAEDSEYARRLRESGLLLTEYEVKGLLYHYSFQSHNKSYK